jgi:molecular chaperone GrpE (heat shock protein)
MEQIFEIVEDMIPLPKEVEELDLQSEFVRQIVRCSKLENRLEEIQKSGIDTQRKLLAGLLDVVDALDRILQRPLGSQDPRQAFERQSHNIDATRRLLLQKLAQTGVRQMNLEGMVADPLVADVTEYQDNPDLPDETVVREVVRAYLWNAELLRRGQVVVSRNL